MSAMQKVKDALLKAGFSGKESRDDADGAEKPSSTPHVAMDFIRKALDAAAPWWQTQGAAPKNGERIVNSPVERETEPTALAAGKHMEAMQRRAGSRPPIGKLSDSTNGIGEDGAAQDAVRKALDASSAWWLSQGAQPKNGERIVNSPGEGETVPSATGAGKHMEAMQRKAGSRPPSGKMPDSPKGMDEALAMDGFAMDANDMAAAATQMMSELEKHDKQHHHGQYTGGTCKLRDKIAHAAKNLGMSPKAVEKITGKKAGAEGGGAPAPESSEPDESPEFKEFDGLRKKIMDDAKASMEGKTPDEEKQIAQEAFSKLRAARFDYLTKALKMSPAEAGACSEIAERVENGSEAAKQVVENLPDEQKKIVESVTATEETTVTGEGSEHADDSGTNEEQSDAQFADELKKLMPEKAAMVDKLTQNFDTINDLLNDEQKKRFWELNEGGDEAAFYTFLGDECGFSADEVSALRDLTDAYRAANPDDYPEYAEQHKHDELLARVKKADRRLNNDVKRGKLSGIKNRLEIKGFSNEEIEQYMDAMGLTEGQKFAVMNDLPVPPKVLTPEEIAQKKAEQSADEKMDAYRKAHDQASKDHKLDDPETVQKLNDLLKEAMEAQKAAKNPATAAPTDAPAQEATATAEGTASAETGAGGITEGGNAPTPTANATAEEVAAQPKEDPVSEGMTPEDHAKVCKANPKSNCPFLKAHMSEEALAALDKPELARPAATVETATTAPATGETAAPASGAAQPTSEPSAGAVPPDSSGGETATPAETAEPTTEAAEQQEPSREGGSKMPYEERRDELYKNIDKAYDAWNEAQRKYEEALNSGKSIIDPEVKELREKRDEAGDAVLSAITAFSDSLGTGREDDQSGGTAEPSETPEATAPNEAPPPLPIPPDPLPDYDPPNVEGWSVSDDAKAGLEDLKDAYDNAKTAEERNGIREMYENYMAELDQQAAMAQSARDVENDERARTEEAKHPGFVQNMKNFFGGIKNAYEKMTGTNPSQAERRLLGLPEKGRISKKEMAAALAGIRERHEREEKDERAKEEARNAEYSTPLPATDGITLADASLLDPIPQNTETDKEADDVAKRIAKKMSDAGEVKGMNTTVGDTATTVELTVGDNFNIKKAQGMLSTLGLASGATVTSVEPVKGKPNTVAVQFTNNKARLVPFAAIVDSNEWKQESAKTGIPVVVGRDAKNKPIVRNLAKMPHTLITGSTGSGKSVCLQSLIHSSQMAKTPKQLRQVCIDGKGQEFGSQEGSPYNLFPVKPGMTEPKDAAKILDSLVNIMKDRQQKCAKYKDLDAYNASHGESDQLPYVVTYIDELATYTKDPEYGKQITSALDQLLAKGRSLGMNFVLSTQRGDVDSVAGKLKANIPGRMTFKAAPDDAKASDEAKGLGGYGDMILEDGKGEKVRGRGAWISDRESKAIEDHYKHQVSTSNDAGHSDSPAAMRPSKPSAPTHVGNTPDGMEIHKSTDGKMFFKHNGRQYKKARVKNKDGSVTEGWKLADGSDPTVYTMKKAST